MIWSSEKKKFFPQEMANNLKEGSISPKSGSLNLDKLFAQLFSIQKQ
jgi:hypothetical protein